MSQFLLQNVSREILDRAEESVVPAPQLGRLVDDYFVERLKREEMAHSDDNTRLYEGLRHLLKTDLLPFYGDYVATIERIRERQGRRRLWTFVLGTVAVIEVTAAVVTRGRSLLPQEMVLWGIVGSILGFLVYAAAQHFDDRQIVRARRRLEKSIQHLGQKLQTDLAYDQRRELFEGDVLRAEALEALAKYESPAAFWRDFRSAREADPTTTADLERLGLPGFAGFLQRHVDGHLTSVARLDRFNRLFLIAHETFVGRDRERYALDQARASAPGVNPSSS
jgi:hypothetical protein